MEKQLRVPPHCSETEAAVLGSIMQSDGGFVAAAGILVAGNFYLPKHRVVWEACARLHEAGKPIDLVTVLGALKDTGALERAGGVSVVAGLADQCPVGAGNVAHYARTVREKAVLREVIAGAADVISTCYGGETGEALDALQQLALTAGGRMHTGGAAAWLEDVLHREVQALEARWRSGSAMTGIATGLYDLDRMTAGLQKKDLVILAARPAMGKTALAVNMALDVAAEGAPVLVFSLEMSAEQLAGRMLAKETGIDGHRIRTGRIQDGDWQVVMETAGRIRGLPIIIDDTAAVSHQAIRARARESAMRHGVGLVIVDYLQLVTTASSRAGNREQEVAEISRSMKALAKELNAPVLVLSQLNRGLESRQNKRPMLADLRESGSIEQDADVVLFLYRDEVYRTDSDKKGLAEVIIAKHRNGPTGTVEVGYVARTMCFRNIDRVHERVG